MLYGLETSDNRIIIPKLSLKGCSPWGGRRYERIPEKGESKQQNVQVEKEGEI